MNIFITGGAGFIGSHLVRYFSNKGDKITIFDNFSNSSNKVILANSNIKIITGDILDYPLLSKSLNDIETVIHLAAQIRVSDSIKDPNNTMKINVNGTQNVLDVCLKHNVKFFLLQFQLRQYLEIKIKHFQRILKLFQYPLMEKVNC